MNDLLEHLNIKIEVCRDFNSFSMPKPVRLQKRTVAYYELDYFLESEGGVKIEDAYVPFAADQVNFRRPGQVVQGLGQYHCYCIFVSLYHRGAEGEEPIGENTPLYDAMHQIPSKITGETAIRIGLVMKRLYQYYIHGEVLLVKSELFRLIHELLTVGHSSMVSYNSYVKKAISYMNENYKNEIDFEELASYVGISKPYLFSVFKESTGTTPNKFLTRLRIDKAKYLLGTTDLQIKDVGFECGFDDSVYFSYLFRKETGIPASVFRDREQKN